MTHAQTLIESLSQGPKSMAALIHDTGFGRKQINLLILTLRKTGHEIDFDGSKYHLTFAPPPGVKKTPEGWRHQFHDRRWSGPYETMDQANAEHQKLQSGQVALPRAKTKIDDMLGFLVDRFPDPVCLIMSRLLLWCHSGSVSEDTIRAEVEDYLDGRQHRADLAAKILTIK